ncbi:MAG TPA: L-serine ammonia-lyase, iron-sulfur-dependent, subunit alpha [Thermotogota bacterium]|nr:L-serine ammonia-lyase, iron-sulfur-dependent, subunit alpha [Thermotogota bacterium]HPR97642.1 L-serine ammonia-lyase, iron-sulfur-dependent, subunit alpha [Thermotogota bacterium]
MYSSAEELIKRSRELNCRLSEIVIKDECEEQETTEKALRKRMKKHYEVMRESAAACQETVVPSMGGLIGGDAKRVNDYTLNGKTICGDTITLAMSMAFSTSEINAAMGRICAAPTAGSAGIIPAAVITTAQRFYTSEKKIIDALFTASGIGKIIALKATLSGAEGGCQAECGSAAAMAAGAVVEMVGGSPEQSFDASAFALKSVMGLICDPIAGLVEAPCALRNASGVVNALICADMALAGVKSLIPFDEVVEAMYMVGKALPFEFRETALGGIATTETGKRFAREIFGE